MVAAIKTSLSATPIRDTICCDLRDHLDELHACLASVCIKPLTGLDDAVTQLSISIHEPGPFYTLSHGDSGPHNIQCLDTQPIWIDFEAACFQHGFVDLVGPRMAFPTAGLARRLLADIIRRIEDAYRAELVSTIPMMSDDEIFQ